MVRLYDLVRPLVREVVHITRILSQTYLLLKRQIRYKYYVLDAMLLKSINRN